MPPRPTAGPSTAPRADVRRRATMSSSDASAAGPRRAQSRRPSGAHPGPPHSSRRSPMTDVRNIVLVHGGFVDGSGSRGVYDRLTADGLNVSVVQNQTLSLESDVETTRDVLDRQDGPAILVGHSYGGVVITEAGQHERVAGLVYIAAVAPDAGESVNPLIADPPPGAPVPPILPPVDGFLFLDRERFAESFAADLAPDDAAFMADSQVPWGVEALNGPVR